MQRAFIDTKHIEFERWGPPQVDADWHASCQAICEAIEGDEWKELHYRYRELNQAAGAKKPSESQKAKALSAMKAARDRDEEFYAPARKDGGTKLNMAATSLHDDVLLDTEEYYK